MNKNIENKKKKKMCHKLMTHPLDFFEVSSGVEPLYTVLQTVT